MQASSLAVLRCLLLGLLLLGTTLHAVPRYSPDEQENIRINQAASRAVVNITSIAINYDYFFRPMPAGQGIGTGFLIDKRGTVVTNYHVIEKGQKLVVTLSDNSQWPAKLIGADPNNDLAVLRIDAPKDRYGILRFSNSEDLVVGQKVLALGNPFGLKQTLTTGIISALGRTIEATNRRKISGIIQTDAAINPGNSGGPLLDTEGKVIGINTAIIAGGGGGIGFSIPINMAQNIATQLISEGRVVGVRTGAMGIDRDGVRKATFQPGMDIFAKVTILGEGVRGSLAKQLIDRFELEQVGVIENRPGIAPSASHKDQLAAKMKAQGCTIIGITNY